MNVDLMQSKAFLPSFLTLASLFSIDGNGIDGKVSKDTYKLTVLYRFNTSVGGVLMPSRTSIGLILIFN